MMWGRVHEKKISVILWVIVTTVSIGIELGIQYWIHAIDFQSGWGAKKTSRRTQDRRAQERRCKRIPRGDN